MSSHENGQSAQPQKKHRKTQRRPGRDPIEGAPGHEAHPEENNPHEHQEMHKAADEHEDRKKVKIEFYGSEILKQKVPGAFGLAESVAEEWVNDGRFEDLPVESPLAKAFAMYGLRKAKKIEKKLEEKGVFALVKSGIDYAQSKIRR